MDENKERKRARYEPIEHGQLSQDHNSGENLGNVIWEPSEPPCEPGILSEPTLLDEPELPIEPGFTPADPLFLPAEPMVSPVEPLHLTVEPSEPPEEPGQLPLEPDSHILNENMLPELLEFGACEVELESIPLQEDCNFESGDSPIYPGAPITIHQSLVSILALVLTFQITGSCLKTILDLIRLHCPPNNKLPKSLYFFKNYFCNMQGPKQFEYYCSSCLKKCSRAGCDECKDSKLCYLVKLSLIDQLKTILKRKGIGSCLRMSNESHTPQIFSDIYDGKVYQEEVQRGFLRNSSNLSFQWYTDGASLFKSSNMSVWPVYFTINELPYSKRFRKENVLLPAIWCGPVKPSGNLFVESVYPDLATLSRGVEFHISDLGPKLVKCFVLCGTGDTPARSLMLNMVAHNGEYSCQKCEQPGMPRPDCPGVRIFPFKPEEMIPRSEEKMLQHGLAAKPDQHVKGCKGVTGLSTICRKYVQGTAIDQMHQSYGGVGKTVLKLLTKTKHSSEKWSISQHTPILNERLKSIKPPSHFPRLPRSLEDLANWKTSELKAFFLDYSLAVYDDILPEAYLEHHSTIVAALQILSADTVTKENVNVARRLLEMYVSQFCDLYSVNFLTINFHLLLHLADLVEDLGPLWVTTCFPLESLNGVVLNLVHGTRWAEKQIAGSLQMTLGLPDLVHGLNDGTAKNFCSTLLNQKRRKCTDDLQGCLIFGSYVAVKQKLPIVVHLLRQMNLSESNKVLQFHCLRKGKYLYVALSNKISTLRDSSVALY